MKAYYKLFGAGALLCSSLQAFSVPAYPGMITVNQEDGSTLNVRRLGDEYHNIIVTQDGYPLLFNARTHNYEYAMLEDARIVSSGIVASEVAARKQNESDFLRSLDVEALEARFNSDWASARNNKISRPVATGAGPARIVKNSYNVPTTGDRDVLVILVDFTDVKFTDCEYTPDPKDYYDRFFHEKGFSDNGCHGSAYDYYYKGSLGNYRPNFHVYGPVKVSGGYADYAGNGGSALTYNLIKEVVPIVNREYDVDFSIFDTDGDGLVDNVYCLYAGYGQADSPVSDSIWPHSYSLGEVHAEFEIDGVTINRYTVSQQINGVTDLPVGIGTFVHEFGHVLGLADHYNNSSKFGNPVNNVGTWDVMSAGSYNNDQNCPAPFSAFERYSLDWYKPEVLTGKEGRKIELTPYMDDGKAYRINVTKDDKEYFLIENRQQTDWDEYLPGHGVLVWHIEENQIAWDQNKPNYDQNHQMVDIVEAGNVLTSSGHPSDAFPGTKDVRWYNFFNWSNQEAFGFDWVEEQEDGKCWLLFSNSDYKAPAPSIKAKEIMGTSAILEWNSDEPAINYEISVKAGDEEVFFHAAEGPGEIRVENLTPETEYVVNINGSLNSLKSETGESSFTTLSRQIEEYAPEVYPAREIEETSFLARWIEVPVATDYEVQLYGRSHDAQGGLEHGFDNFSTSNPGMPEGWDITAKQGRLETEYGKAAPSLRLRDNDARLLVAIPGEKIDSISFWFGVSKAGIILTVDKSVDGNWSEVWKYVPDRKRDMTKTIDVCGADSVRLVVSREEGVTGGYLCVDDVTLYYIHDRFSDIRTYQLGPAFSEMFEKNEVCSFRISGLEAGEKYGFRVRGIYDGRYSIWSEVMNVEEGMEDPERKPEPEPENPDDPDVGAVDVIMSDQYKQTEIFNLQGIRIHENIDNLPAGIYIINNRKVLIRK